MAENQRISDDPLAEVRKLRREVTGKNSILMKKAPHVDVRCTYDNDVLMELLGEIKSLREDVKKQNEENKKLSIEMGEIKKSQSKMKEDLEKQNKTLLEQFKNLEVSISTSEESLRDEVKEQSEKIKHLSIENGEIREVCTKIKENQEEQKKTLFEQFKSLQALTSAVSTVRKEVQLIHEKLDNSSTKRESMDTLIGSEITQKTEGETSTKYSNVVETSKTIQEEIVGTWKGLLTNGKKKDEIWFQKYEIEENRLKVWMSNGTPEKWDLLCDGENWRIENNTIISEIKYTAHKDKVSLTIKNGILLVKGELSYVGRGFGGPYKVLTETLERIS